MADAAVRAFAEAASAGKVGVVGDLDRRGRVRTARLRHELARCGVGSVDLSPRRPTWQDLEATRGVDAATVLVDTASQHALAAYLAVTHGLPLVTLPGADEPSGRRTYRPVVGLRGDSLAGLDDVALAGVEFVPATADACRLALRVTGGGRDRARELPTGARLRLAPLSDGLAVEVESPGASGWTGTARGVTVVPVWGRHTILRDGVPVADLGAPVDLGLRDDLELHLA